MYDVIGSGEGTAGLLACALLSRKGLSCLYVDTSPEYLWPDLLLPMTRSFYQGILCPLVATFSPFLLRSLKFQPLPVRHIVENGNFIPVPEEVDSGSKEKAVSRKYASLLRRALKRPEWIWWGMKGRKPGENTWEEMCCHAFGMACAGRISRLQTLASRHDMHGVGQDELKNVLLEILTKHNGVCLKDPCAEPVTHNGEPLGLKVAGSVCKAARYITDSRMDGLSDGFHLYGRCEMTDLPEPFRENQFLLLHPPDELEYPVALCLVPDSDCVTVSFLTRIKSDNQMISLMETFSWGSAMVLKHLSKMFSPIGANIRGFDAVDPVSENAIRPYFSFSSVPNEPSLFDFSRYIKPQEKLFSAAKDKYSWLGADGEIFWGICIANAILRDLGRSDLIAFKA